MTDAMTPDPRPELVRLEGYLREIERHCPCGARPESPRTHPHVGGCPVAEALTACRDAASALEAHDAARTEPMERLRLNAYGRQCYDAGRASAKAQLAAHDAEIATLRAALKAVMNCTENDGAIDYIAFDADSNVAKNARAALGQPDADREDTTPAVCTCGTKNPKSARYGSAYHLKWCSLRRTGADREAHRAGE